MAKTLEEYGKDSVWCCQTGSVNLNGAHTETLEAMQFLGDWFKKKTGKMLVITSVVDGSSHQSGEHSHSADGNLIAMTLVVQRDLTKIILAQD